MAKKFKLVDDYKGFSWVKGKSRQGFDGTIQKHWIVDEEVDYGLVPDKLVRLITMVRRGYGNK